MADSERPPRPPSAKWRTGLLVVGAILLSVVLILVFLVLTGIIAEPETLIEHIVRALAGG